jgi:hypothetical protein
VHLLDFLRLVAMGLMIQGHALAAMVAPACLNQDQVPWWIWESLRGLTAPMFLLISGAASVLGLRYGTDGRLAPGILGRRLRMAALVAGIGYLMVFPANRLADLRWVSPVSWRAFLAVNILQANGATLALLTALLAWARTVRRYAAWSVGTGLGILLATPLVAAVDWFRWLPEGIGAYLSYEHGSLFPLFPASAYMFLGGGLGALLLEAPPERRVRTFRLACLGAGASALLVSWVAQRVPLATLPPDQAWRGAYAYTTCRLGFALALFGALAWLVELRPALAAAWAPLGRRSLFAYVAHLALIFGTPWTPGLMDGPFHDLTPGQGVLWVLLVGGVTFGAIRLWDWARDRSRGLGALLYVSAVIALVRLLLWGGLQLRPFGPA